DPGRRLDSLDGLCPLLGSRASPLGPVCAALRSTLSAPVCAAPGHGLFGRQPSDGGCRYATPKFRSAVGIPSCHTPGTPAPRCVAPPGRKDLHVPHPLSLAARCLRLCSAAETVSAVAACARSDAPPSSAAPVVSVALGSDR